MTERKRRAPNPPWKGLYGKDRRFTARVDRAMERDEYTEAGTKPNAADPQKIARKQRARRVA